MLSTQITKMLSAAWDDSRAHGKRAESQYRNEESVLLGILRSLKEMEMKSCYSWEERRAAASLLHSGKIAKVKDGWKVGTPDGKYIFNCFESGDLMLHIHKG